MPTALMRSDFGVRPRFPAERGRPAAWGLPLPQGGPAPVRQNAAGAFAAGLASATFRRLLPAAIVGLARQAGLAGIAWSDAHAPMGAPASPDPEAGLGVIGAVSRASGLDCIAYDADVADADRFAAALAAAEKLGARSIRIRPGAGGRPSEDYGAAERRRIAAAIRRMADGAARRKLSLSLASGPNALADGADAARRLLEAIDHPGVDLDWQPRPGLALAAALAEIAVLGRFVRNVRIGACDERGRRLPLAARANWWSTVLDALRAERQHADRWAFLDGVRDDDTRAFAEDAQCLADLLARRA